MRAAGTPLRTISSDLVPRRAVEAAAASDVHLALNSLFRFYFQVATFFLVALAVGAEKKIELQDIEEDNLRSELKSEPEKDNERSDGQQNSGPVTALGYNSLDFMKTGIMKFFEGPQSQSYNPQLQQQQRYVHQYAVTEPPESFPPPGNKEQYQSDGQKQAMVGYLSNIPMQIYLVPHVQQYLPPQTSPPLAEFNLPRGPSAANTYVQAYVPRTPPPQPVTFVYPAQPTATPALAEQVQPVLGYHLPVLHYNNQQGIQRVVASNAPKSYFATPEYSDTNTIDESSTQSEAPQYLQQEQEFPRHYNSRAPIRGHYKSHPGISELPHPNPLLLKAPAPHLAHIPRALPMLRPYTKQVYQEDHIPSSFFARPHVAHGPFKRRPTSLLDSYVPSRVQAEYLKRGLAKDPLTLYEALASGRLPHTIPRHVERGFLPNQMYPTAAGGVTYGHYKRNIKVPHK